MRLFATDAFPLPLPAGHRFPVAKYRLLREAVEPLLGPGDEILPAPAATTDELRLAHDADYIRRFESGELAASELRRLGLPWSPELVERSRRSVGATIAACRAALVDGVAANLAGGTHHAMRGACSGYCVYNDAAVAVRVLQREGQIGSAAIIDCDVHQGDGTAAIFAGDRSVFTFSIHGGKNFPFRKEPGDLDIDLADGTGDDAYLEALERGLERTAAQIAPDLVVYLAGADPYQGDRLGRLALTTTGLKDRDRLVLRWVHQMKIPVAIAMAGGYAHDINDTVKIQSNTIRLALEVSRLSV